MAGCVSTAKFVSTLLLDSLSISRRGYAAVAGSQGARTVRNGAVPSMMGKDEGAEKAWVPDPVTGYYRPANRPNEIDVADLRDLLLKPLFVI